MPRGRIDLTGQQFGQWTVLDWSHHTINGGTYWNCECSCGTRKAVRSQHLRHRISTRCRTCSATARRRDLTGQVFGQWTVLRIGTYDAQGRMHWHCKCSCGNTSMVRGGNLLAEVSRRCTSCAVRLRRKPAPK